MEDVGVSDSSLKSDENSEASMPVMESLSTDNLNGENEGSDWTLEQMETVSLEVEEEPKMADGLVVFDTVAFEQEAEVVESVYDAAPSDESYFQEPLMDFSMLSEGQSDLLPLPSTVVSPPSPPLTVTARRESAMLASCYIEPVAIDEKDITGSVANLDLKAPSSVESLVEEVKEEEQITEPAPVLSRFFQEEKFGSDHVGKAFFDALAQTVPSAPVPFIDMDGGERGQSAGITESESYDAWIPKATTRQALDVLAAAPPGTYFPEKEHLTMPGVIITEDLRDPIRDLERQYVSEEASHQRVTLTADNVSQDEDGLRKLISVGCFRAAVNLTTRLLTLHGQGLKKAGHPSRHTPRSLQVWLTRLTLLVKLQLFNMAEAESEPFGDLDRPDLYYEFYGDVFGRRQGCMVPFTLRLLLPRISTCVGKFGIALDRLYSVLNVVTKIIGHLEAGLTEDGTSQNTSNEKLTASLTLWQERELKVLYTITNCLIAQNDFFLAHSLLETILQKTPENVAKVRSAQGHVLLQLGDVKAAQASFAAAAEARGEQLDEQVDTLVDRALMLIANNNFNEAYHVLLKAQALQVQNPVVVNNMAVCLLYTGQLRAACQLLESAIANAPDSYIHECILVNVCTLYDLESSRSLQKKSGMLEIVGRHAGDGFNVFCLKLQNAT